MYFITYILNYNLKKTGFHTNKHKIENIMDTYLNII